MVTEVAARRFELLEVTSTAFGDEAARRDPDAAIGSELWSTVAVMNEHLGRNYLWAAAIIRSGEPVDRRALARAPREGARAWFEECRATAITAVQETDPDRACWTLFDRPGTVAFWERRMLFETTRHLVDMRAAGGLTMVPAGELAPIDYADGVDELFEVFLPRTRDELEQLPRPLTMIADDVPRRWTLHEDWHLTADVIGASQLIASAGDLALFVWERADPFSAFERFQIDGPEDAVTAFAAAQVHG